MNPIAVYFLPSQVRGVYRFDEMLAKTDADSFEQFVANKLRFLPCSLIEPIRHTVEFEEDFKAASEQLFCATPPPDPGRRRAKQFFGWHSYFQNALEGTGEGADNYLEIQFVRKILAPLLSLEGLTAVQPQKQVGPYFVDFAFDGQSQLALEIDGFSKFSQRQDLDNFLQRQNYLVSQGWQVLRFSYSQIMSTSKMTSRFFQDVLAADPFLAPFLASAPPSPSRQQSLFSDLAPQPGRTSAVDFVNTFHRIQDWFVQLTITDPTTELVLRDDLDFPLPLVGLALSALYRYFEAIAGVVDVDFNIPSIQVSSQAASKKWKAYLHPAVTITKRQFSQFGLQVTRQHLRQATSLLPLPFPDNHSLSYRRNLSLDQIHQRLEYFTREIFGYANGTNRFQDQVFERIFNEKETLGISTTGSGKSFCFWLPALLKPGLSLVVAPLKSLMRDQRLSLQNNGIASAEFINSEVNSDEQLRFMAEAKAGYLRLLYISPERLRIKKFVEQLADLQQVVPINLLAIDEAHCLSEWGHDFRPSYLKLPLKRKELATVNPSLRLVALTATAGQMVEQDIRNILGLTESDVIREPVADREYFSYQIVPVGDGGSKTEAFRKVVRNDLATALKQQSLSALLAHRNGRQEKTVGLVFCIYADPHGKNTVLDGTTHYLFETMGILEHGGVYSPRNGRAPYRQYDLEAFLTGKVRAFSSKPPTLCPRCYSYYFTTRTNGRHLVEEDIGDVLEVIDEITPRQRVGETGQKICHHCGEVFGNRDVHTFTEKHWGKLTRTNQNDFKNSRFDILVATKGFGMGIDKSSVRFVIHTSLSSGLESWYQEVGRAGRDNERSHIVLITDPPNNSCYEELTHPFIKRPRCSWTGGCPHGRHSICDYGKQHIFITRSYPGAEADAIRALRILDNLLASYEQTGENPVFMRFRFDDETSADELSLYRLTCLGIVDDYMFNYGPRPHIEVSLRVVSVPDNENEWREVGESIWSNLFNHMRQHWKGDSNINIKKRIDGIRGSYKPLAKIGNKIEKFKIFKNMELMQFQYEFFNLVYEYLLLLLDYTYKDVVKMRYDMLWNLCSVVMSVKEKKCQRAKILPYFERQGSVEENYHCGCCNSCEPDLYFLDRVTPREKNKSIESFEIELSELLKNNQFNITILKKIYTVFQDYRTSTYTKGRAVLEGAPNNLPALYLTWKFSPPEELSANTKRFFQTANEQGLPLSHLKDLYQEAILPPQAELVPLLNELNSTCDSLEGWEFLTQEAAKYQHRGDSKLDNLHDCLEFFLLVEELPPETETLRNKAHVLEEILNA